MSATTEPSARLLENTRESRHPRCIVCGRKNECGLGLKFRLLPDGGVEAEISCPDTFEGYEDILHGGVISSMLDGAMTNCLFARGLNAFTAELNVRFRHAIHTRVPMTVRAHVTRQTPPIHVLEAQILQERTVKATASGKFVEKGVSSINNPPA